MTTLVVEDLFEEAQDMVNTIAQVNVVRFLEHVGKHAGVLLRVCQCPHCPRDERWGTGSWSFFGLTDPEGMPGGVSHGACRGQVAWARAQMAAPVAFATQYARAARN